MGPNMARNKQEELPVPPAAATAQQATELVRVWAAGDGQHISLRPDFWDDPAAWGLLLVDLARHIAIAHERSGIADAQSVLNRLKEGFDAEWSDPTDAPSGGLLE
jgi:hypothetical protein